MVIKRAKTIEEFKEIRDKKVQNWIDNNFIEGSVIWRWLSASNIEIKDKFGDTVEINSDEIN